MTKQQEIDLLKKQLVDMQKFHLEVCLEYGSELASGEMFLKEKDLEDKIKKLEIELIKCE